MRTFQGFSPQSLKKIHLNPHQERYPIVSMNLSMNVSGM